MPRQWMGVFSFLPTVYLSAGIAPQTAAVLTALATTVHLVGNLLGGRLAQRRVPPHRTVTVAAGAMAFGAWLAFGSTMPFAGRYGGILLLTVLGGLIPGTLFTIAPRLAPSAGAISTTVGLMQQGSTLETVPVAAHACRDGLGHRGVESHLAGHRSVRDR
jgi:cyanate permease